MDEDQAQHIYAQLMESNKAAFSARLCTSAYHMLAAAMYLAVSSEDSYKLLEVEIAAREQYEELLAREQQVTPGKETMDVSLYRSLIQMARTRLLLIPKHK